MMLGEVQCGGVWPSDGDGPDTGERDEVSHGEPRHPCPPPSPPVGEEGKAANTGGEAEERETGERLPERLMPLALMFASSSMSRAARTKAFCVGLIAPILARSDIE